MSYMIPGVPRTAIKIMKIYHNTSSDKINGFVESNDLLMNATCECECLCGNKFTAELIDIIRGTVVDCGHCNPEYAWRNLREYDPEAYYRIITIYNGMRSRVAKYKQRMWRAWDIDPRNRKKGVDCFAEWCISHGWLHFYYKYNGTPTTCRIYTNNAEGSLSYYPANMVVIPWNATGYRTCKWESDMSKDSISIRNEFPLIYYTWKVLLSRKRNLKVPVFPNWMDHNVGLENFARYMADVGEDGSNRIQEIDTGCGYIPNNIRFI